VYWFYQSIPCERPKYGDVFDLLRNVGDVNQFNAGILILRVIFGLFLAYHGYNKFFGPAGLAGPAAFFESMGMRWPKWQARLAATTEVVSGVLLAAGLLTPLAAAGMIGVMLVAIVADHWKVGFFIFLPNQGWEYCASILTAAFVVAMVGPGRWSLDHGFGIEWNGWTGAIVAGVVGLGAALLQLAVSYRRPVAA
jgi:putative oxidoreductase